MGCSVSAHLMSRSTDCTLFQTTFSRIFVFWSVLEIRDISLQTIGKACFLPIIENWDSLRSRSLSCNENYHMYRYQSGPNTWSPWNHGQEEIAQACCKVLCLSLHWPWTKDGRASLTPEGFKSMEGRPTPSPNQGEMTWKQMSHHIGTAMKLHRTHFFHINIINQILYITVSFF